MALPAHLLRNLLAGHANLDLVCQLSSEAAAAAERERELSGAAAAAAARESEALRGTIAALQQALDLARGGGGGGGGGSGGGGAAGAALVMRAEADALARAAVSDCKKVHSFESVGSMHSVCSISSEASASSGGGGGGGGAAAPSSPTAVSKASVAEFYGLSCADSPGELVDMLGVRRPFLEVELAHLWPASFQNFGSFAAEMALPANFHATERNYLLLPKDLHQAFDSAKVCFIPCSAGIRLRVLRPEGLCARVAAMDGELLHLPSAAANPSRVPFKRILGWMAWLAKGASALAPAAEREMSEALGASASAEGNAALRSLVATAEQSGYRSGSF